MRWASPLRAMTTTSPARPRLTRWCPYKPRVPRSPGGGWISQGTGRTSFGFNVISDVTGLHGQLQIRSHGNKSRFHSTSVLTLSPSGTSGTWTGTGRWNGVDGYTFTVSVVDSGKEGDTISIVIKSPANVIVFTTGGPQPLKGGNIVVH